MATDAFKEHKLVLCEKERWRIAKSDASGLLHSAFYTEVISLWGGRLFVGGDIDDCVFGRL